MKKVLFIMTHLGSGWELLVDKLQENARVHVFNTSRSYHHPDDVRFLTNEIHRQDNSAAIWADVLFFNENFTMKRLAKDYRFIFWSCPFESVVEQLVVKYKYSEDAAESYYNFRLAGMSQYYRRVPGCLWNPDLQQNLVF